MKTFKQLDRLVSLMLFGANLMFLTVNAAALIIKFTLIYVILRFCVQMRSERARKRRRIERGTKGYGERKRKRKIGRDRER